MSVSLAKGKVLSGEITHIHAHTHVRMYLYM